MDRATWLPSGSPAKLPLSPAQYSQTKHISAVLKQVCIELYGNGVVTDTQLEELFSTHPDWRKA